MRRRTARAPGSCHWRPARPATRCAGPPAAEPGPLQGGHQLIFEPGPRPVFDADQHRAFWRLSGGQLRRGPVARRQQVLGRDLLEPPGQPGQLSPYCSPSSHGVVPRNSGPTASGAYLPDADRSTTVRSGSLNYFCRTSRGITCTLRSSHNHTPRVLRVISDAPALRRSRQQVLRLVKRRKHLVERGGLRVEVGKQGQHVNGHQRPVQTRSIGLWGT